MGFKFNFIKNLFPPLTSIDEEGKNIIAKYLKTILVVTIVVMPSYAIYSIIYNSAVYPFNIILLSLTLIMGFLLVLVNKKKVFLAGSVFLIMLWGGLTMMAFFSDGINDTSIFGYTILIFLATLLVGARFALIITGFSIGAVWMMTFLPPRNGFFPPGDLPAVMAGDYTVMFVMVIAAVVLYSRSYRYSYDRINKELQERIKAEKKLSQNEIILREQNMELIYARDKAEESDRLKTAFLHNISHEIRTPMNGIVGFLELLKHSDTDKKKQEEYIGIINTCTQQLASIVNDLIDISKIETGTIELNISEFQSDLLVTELESTFGTQASDKGLTLSVVNETESWWLKADQGKIFQVLNNLVSNAIKFTHNGSISVRISKDQNNLLISVKDTGIGIKESEKELIFKRFSQSEIGLDRSFGGSGLGLSISKGNVDFLGGRIWFDSKPGSGSSFSFTVPVEFLTGEGKVKEESQETDLSGKLKILVAEDDHINYLYIKELLGATSCELMWAKDGLEAVEKVGTISDFDVVLMDLKMPVMNGYEATQRIKGINPTLPVIAVTAFALQEDIEMSTGARFDGYIVKPIERNDLLSKLQRI